jgi:hypothetical protein
MKVWFISAIAFFSCSIAVNSRGETVVESESICDETTYCSQNATDSGSKSNICDEFYAEKKSSEQSNEAPPPVRTWEDSNPNTAAINGSEEILYQQLGLTPFQDGSYVCMATDPQNSRREFTLFKVKKINDLVVVSTFLDEDNFIVGQKQATTDLFLEMMQFYTDIPQEYYPGINNYFEEFYARMADGRLKPSSDRVYAVDEPSTTVVMYHPLQGEMTGTAISLNIPLSK